MSVKIIEYFDTDNKSHWNEAIDKGDWEAARYLGKLLHEDKLRDLCGPKTKLFLVVDGDVLCSFCTLAEQDEIKAPEMTPWVGFVYTFPEFRGKHLASKVIDHACNYAKELGFKEVYASPSLDTVELYEKYGFYCLDYTMTSIYGYETTVFCKEL